MDKYYTLNELATITGLTTRTLRNYLKSSILSGEKIDGIWQFTEEELSDFLSHPAVSPSIKSKKNALVYDFMLDTTKKNNEMCTIVDLCVGDEEAEEISDFFCSAINNASDNTNLQFSYEKSGPHVRVILRGYDEAVLKFLNSYYQTE